MAKMDYNSISFRNSDVDKFKGKFGKGQTEKNVTVKPSAEQVSRVKGRMESDINRMDAEVKGYEYATPGASSCSVGKGLCKSDREDLRGAVSKSTSSNKFVGKNIQSTREAYQGVKKAHSYAKSQFEKS
jgi:hypothetical protein